MIEARDLTKIYAGKAAVDHLTFTVEPGQVTGFLGPNGAGKSTTMRLILGLDRPQSGIALINGRRYRDLKDPLRTVGALLEAKTVHPGRSARNHLLFLAQTQGLPARRVEEVLALVGLQDVADKRAGGFSLGMSQRLGVAVAMLGDPEVLLLDEPVNGLDPEGVLWIRNLMKQLAAEGRTILVSSHLMNEMAVTADHLIVIGRGKLITEASTEDVIARSTDKSVRVRTPDADRLAELITAAGGKVVRGAPADGAGLLTVTGLEAPRIGELAASASIVLHELTPLASLEGAFMELTSGSVEFGVPGPDPVKTGEREGPMTTTSPVTPTRGPADPAAGRHAGFAGLLRAEWTKIRSVRSTVWTLVIFVVVCIGFTALIAWLTETHWYGPRAASRDVRAISDPVGFILGTGVGLGQLAIGVLGVLVITSEYSSGVIRASLLAVPRRLPVLAAKAVVFAVLLLVVTEIVAFCSFFVGSAILHAHVPVSLSGSGVTRAVAGAGLYLTVLGLLALAIGTMIRHTAGAISTIIGIVFVLPILSGLLPSSWGAHINAYLPEQAGTLITHTHEQSGDLLSPWQGFGVLCIWTVLALAAAAYLLERRDA